ncbi:MAG: TRAP transporter fused permease subunit [Deltaproteobacteria bacterium]
MGSVFRIFWHALREGSHRKPKGWLATYVSVLSILVAIFEIYVNVTGHLDPYVHSMLFMSLMLGLAFILQSPSKESKGVSRIDICFSIAMICLAAYIWFHRERLLVRFPLVDELTPMDLFFGAIATIALLEATRRILGIGMILPVIGIILYVFAGHLIQGSFYHRYIDLRTFIDSMIFTINGAAGVPMRVAATYVFIFVTLGAFLERSGGGDFFYKLATGVAGGQVGGPAKVAVVSSCAFGMISGSPTSDVATTGSFTIPLMKRMGYSPVIAAAIETVAGTGGAIMPPIMGTAAFLMVEFTGIAYSDIIIASFTPALLYYLCLFVQVHFHSQKIGIMGMPREQRPTVFDAFKDRGEFVIPLTLLVYLIIKGITPALAGIISLAITIPLSWLRKDSRMGLRKIIDTQITAVTRLAPVVAACGAAGLFVGGMSLTGLASKFIALINALSGGIPLVAVLMSAVVLLILGLGMPVPSVYVIAASLIAPVLTKLGIGVFQAHLFIVFYCALAAITPPEAAAAFTAAGIAEADPMKVGWRATLFAIGGYVVPIVFIFSPGILLMGSFGQVVWAIATSAFGVSFLAIGVERFFRGKLGILADLFLVGGGALLLIPSLSTQIAGLLFGGAVLLPRLAGEKTTKVMARFKTASSQR